MHIILYFLRKAIFRTCMSAKSPEKLVIGISSRALFGLDESHKVFEQEGRENYARHQVKNEDNPLEPGVAFPFVRKILRLNEILKKPPPVEVILLSRNSADTGLRVFRSIEHHGLDISRAAFCSGKTPYRYVKAFGCDLFLSTHRKDVEGALRQGVAAATLLAGNTSASGDGEPLCIAFDADAVLVSDEAEQVYQDSGLDAFSESERAAAKRPLGSGPFKGFLAALHSLQQRLEEQNLHTILRTAVVTARSAPAHERLVRTLRAWNIRIDEMLFVGGQDKGAFVRDFGADMFFDDRSEHCASVQEAGAIAGHVPDGAVNSGEKKARPRPAKRPC